MSKVGKELIDNLTKHPENYVSECCKSHIKICLEFRFGINMIAYCMKCGKQCDLVTKEKENGKNP